MSWLFSQALVEEYSEGICSDGELSAQWNVMPTPQGFWRNDKMMEPSRLSQFGLTLRLLTEKHGEAVLMSFLEAFRAKTYQAQGEAKESLEQDQGYGLSSLESLAKYDLYTCSWKTPQYSLLGGLELFSETWPRWGTMRNGECWVQPMWGRRTNGTESGLLPTPSATEGGPMPELAHEPRMNQRNYSKKTGNHCQVTLRRYVDLWPTPTVCGNYNRKGASKTSGDGLATAVKNWPTPQASDNRDRGNLSSPAIKRRREKGKQIMLSQSVSEENGRLNPEWVEWLMGWPIGWTGLKPLEMDRFHQWQQQHSLKPASAGIREAVRKAQEGEQ